METIVLSLVSVLGVYFLIGVVFGLYFLFVGATKIDPVLKDSKWAMRLLFLPGAIATWVYLLPKLFKRS